MDTPTPEPTGTGQAMGGVLATPLVGTPVAPMAQAVTIIHRVITYTYDPLNRLTGAEYSTGESFAYQYDAVGNRVSLVTSNGSTSYEYDAANRLTSVDGVGYTWDARGNLISDGTFTYAYDAAGRMVRAESLTATLVYTYNTNGLRVAQSIDGDVTTFAWDWASALPEMLREGSNLYLVGHDTLGWWDGDGWAYHLPDALGSVRQVVDGAGVVTSVREWTPYGVEMGAAQVGLGYTGEWWDADAALLYLRARYYQPATGRFLTMDSWSGDMRRPSTLNRGVYVTNNPTNLSDPSGHVPSEHNIRHGRNSFSCNCGWIDWGHASPKTARRIIQQVEWERFQWGSPYYKLITREPAGLPVFSVDAKAIVRRGLGESERGSVALGIFMEISEMYEESWFQQLTGSSYTSEDLPSNLIGFYVAWETERSGEGGINDARLKELVGDKERCDVIDDVQWTLEVYKDYEKAGLLDEKNRNWCRAWFLWSCNIAEKCTTHPQWPSAFNWIAPEHSRLGGQWWWAEDAPGLKDWSVRLMHPRLEVWGIRPPPNPMPGRV